MNVLKGGDQNLTKKDTVMDSRVVRNARFQVLVVSFDSELNSRGFHLYFSMRDIYGSTHDRF